MKAALRHIALISVAGSIAFTASPATLVVPGDANIFGAGHTFPPAPAGGGAGSLPTVYPLPPGTGRILQFSSVSGILFNLDGQLSSYPDGYVVSTDITAIGGISGFQAPVLLPLVGVFLGGTEPAHPAPESINFNVIGLDFTTLRPAVAQIFFIGDGLTGSGSGQQQSFLVPDDATRLFLGLPDAYLAVGPPGQYGDNSGNFTASFTIVPEPSAVVLFAFGFLALLFVRRHADHRDP